MFNIGCIHVDARQGAMVLVQSSGVLAAISNAIGSSNAVALSKPQQVLVAVDADASRCDALVMKAFSG